MSILPVIARELRAQARQPLTYWLRMAGGLSVVGAIVAALWVEGGINRRPTYVVSGMTTFSAANSFAGPAPNQFQSFGTTLFSKMNLFIFTAIWLFVPLASADALSRERREGTLPILYLTELRSLGIVVGKCFVHMLRAFSMFLTMAPWLMLPLVFGGVDVRDIEMALLLNLTAVLLAQAAGLLASTIPRDWLKSVILAELFALCLFLSMLVVHGEVLSSALRAGMPPGLTPGTPAFWNSRYSALYEFTGAPWYGGGILARTKGLLEISVNNSFADYVNPRWYYGRFAAQTVWQQIWTTLTPPCVRAWFRGVMGMVIGAALVLLAATWIGAWRIERSWRETPADSSVSELRDQYFRPVFAVQSFKRRLSRALMANPIGWLQQYSTSARLVKWGWCLFIIVVEIIFSSNSNDLYEAQAGLGLLLLLGLTFSATASFRQELETGAFELLLVTPIRERQIVVGRLRGLWQQFLPAILVYGAGMIYLAVGWRDQSHGPQAWLSLTRTMAGYCTLPLVGLYFSVLRWNFFGAWLAACVVGMAPAWLCRSFGAIFGVNELEVIALQFGVGFAAALMLEMRLKSRGFVQEKWKLTELADATA
jgi:ABC-type transport system involved in multi-copper enzyme maturation permease subunit